MSSLLPLVLREASFVAGGRAIVDRVSAEIGAGPRTIILGANGAGKSVLMRMCHGLLAPSSGTVQWNAPEPEGRPRRQAMVFQRPVMLRRSALANVIYALKAAQVPRSERRARAMEALAHVGLKHLADSPARVLSGGEQQRLAFARAWVLRPEVLFLDEPSSNLDPSATKEIEAIIQSIHAAGAKIVMATHNLAQAKRLGDEVLFIHQGRLAERSPIDRFFTHPASPEAEAFIKGELPWA
jgi:tungstate transport system ATP-binding protein